MSGFETKKRKAEGVVIGLRPGYWVKLGVHKSGSGKMRLEMQTGPVKSLGGLTEKYGLSYRAFGSCRRWANEGGM